MEKIINNYVISLYDDISKLTYCVDNFEII